MVTRHDARVAAFGAAARVSRSTLDHLTISSTSRRGAELRAMIALLSRFFSADYGNAICQRLRSQSRAVECTRIEPSPGSTAGGRAPRTRARSLPLRQRDFQSHLRLRIRLRDRLRAHPVSRWAERHRRSEGRREAARAHAKLRAATKPAPSRAAKYTRIAASPARFSVALAT